MFNEFIWALGMAMLAQCYSTYGLEVIAAQNISSTISNVCNVIWIAMGNAIAIIIGQLLGAGKLEEAKDTDRKLIFFSVASCFGIAVLLVGLAFVFPHIYNTEQSVRALVDAVHPDLGSDDAGPGIFKCFLFYDPFRRKDRYYLFL